MAEQERENWPDFLKVFYHPDMVRRRAIMQPDELKHFWHTISIQDTIYVIALLVGLFLVYQYYLGNFDPKMALPSMDYTKELSDPAHPKENVTLVVTLVSPTQSVNAPIAVFAKVALEIRNISDPIGSDSPLNRDTGEAVPRGYDLWLEGTSCRQTTPYDSSLRCWIPLEYRHPRNYEVLYVGNTTAYYTSEGGHDILLGLGGDMKNAQSVGEDFIKIDSLESTNQYYQNHISLNYQRMGIAIGLWLALLGTIEGYRRKRISLWEWFTL